MTAKVLPIVNRVSTTLNDESNIRWTLSELVQHLSDAQRAAVLLKPEINPKVANLPLASGTLQTLPDDAYMLIDVTRNMRVESVDGKIQSTPGTAITPTSRSSMDQVRASWHLPSDDDEILPYNYIYDARNRLSFFVYPGRTFAAEEQVEIIYSKMPPEIELVGGKVTDTMVTELSEIYAPALTHYVLSRAYEKDAPIAGQGPAMSQLHFQAFALMITGREAEANEMALTIRHEIGEKEE